MAFNPTLDGIDRFPVSGNDLGYGYSQTPADLLGSTQLQGFGEMKLARPSFKGSMEDLVMITNFKRFKRKGSSSRYKGVFFVKKEGKYRAQICLKGKKKYVGTFKNDHEAAVARDAKIRELYGEVDELLNFPRSKGGPPLEGRMPSTLNKCETGGSTNTDLTQPGPDSGATAPNIMANLMSGEEISGKTGFKLESSGNIKSNGEAFPGASFMTHMQSDQFAFPPKAKLTSTLSRYGSSSSHSLSLPLGGFSNTVETKNGLNADSGLANNHSFLDLNSPNIQFANNYGYQQFNNASNGYNFADANTTSNGTQAQAQAAQRLFNGGYNQYNNYQSFMNLNFNDFGFSGLPRQRSMLAKRFSSNESIGTTFSFPLQDSNVVGAPSNLQQMHSYPSYASTDVKNTASEVEVVGNKRKQAAATETEAKRSKN